MKEVSLNYQAKKRILIVTQYFWPEEFRINDLVRRLIKTGCEVEILTGRPNYPEGDIFQDFVNSPDEYASYYGARIYRVRNLARGKGKVRLILNYLSFAFLATVFLFKNMKKKQYNSILAVQLSPVFSVIPAILFGKYKGIKVSTWIMDLWPDILVALNLVSSRSALKVVQIISSWVYRNSDALLISSKGFRARLLEFGVCPDRINYFPQWIEEVMIENNLSSKSEFKEVGDILSPFANCKKVIFTGNIGECQDMTTVINAMDNLRSKKDIVLFVVGSGREENRLKDLVRCKGLEGTVKLLGRFPVEYMSSFYYFADVLLLPLSKDPLFEITLPGKAQSYLYAGRPIAGMLDGEGADVLRESGSAIVVSSGDFKKLAQAMEKLAYLPKSESNRMGKAGKSYAEKNFLPDTAINKILDVCDLRP
jgi:colanic acid biosynthesis glycosyl transferase WcaI